MKIYTNSEYEILSLDKQPEIYKYEFETKQKKEELFSNWCDACIYGFRYEPIYEMAFNEDGSNERDEKTGQLLYRLDEGNKISQGYACYPFVDYKTLMLIQKQYEDSQKQVQALNAQIEYLSMLSGIAEEA